VLRRGRYCGGDSRPRRRAPGRHGGAVAAEESARGSDISKLDLLVIQIDGLDVAEDIVLIGAIGIDEKGDKHTYAIENVQGTIRRVTRNVRAQLQTIQAICP
jgi:hypothetical protein